MNSIQWLIPNPVQIETMIDHTNWLSCSALNWTCEFAHADFDKMLLAMQKQSERQSTRLLSSNSQCTAVSSKPRSTRSARDSDDRDLLA